MNTCAVSHDLNTFLRGEDAEERRQAQVERLSARIAFGYDKAKVMEIISNHVSEEAHDSKLVQLLAQFERGLNKEARDEAITFLKVAVTDLIDAAATAEAEQALDGEA